jgi:oligopeptide transport system substrate-binding protein
MYETSEIDTTNVYTADIERVLDPANPLNKELTTVPKFSMFYIGFNHTKPPFDDAKVRQAFCRAIDKDKIIEVVLKDMVKRADGILPPGFPGYYEGIVGLSYDPQKAKELIAESTYKDVSNLPSITFTTSGRGDVSDLNAALVDMWRQNLGVEVQVRQLEPETYYEAIEEEKDEIYASGWAADYPDPENFLDILFHSGSEENTGEYSNPQIDTLLEQARVEQDETARMNLYQKIEQMMVDDAACLPLYFDVSHVLVKPYLENFVVTPMLIPRLRFVSIQPH